MQIPKIDGRKALYGIAVLAIVIVLIGSWIASSNTSPEEIDGGIHMHVGEVYDVVLEENPTTGIRWFVDASEGLEYTDDYVPDKVDPNIVGSGGKRIFSVYADEPGDYEFKLTMKSPWNDKVYQTAEYTFHVE